MRTGASGLARGLALELQELPRDGEGVRARETRLVDQAPPQGGRAPRGVATRRRGRGGGDVAAGRRGSAEGEAHPGHAGECPAPRAG